MSNNLIIVYEIKMTQSGETFEAEIFRDFQLLDMQYIFGFLPALEPFETWVKSTIKQRQEQTMANIQTLTKILGKPKLVDGYIEMLRRINSRLEDPALADIYLRIIIRKTWDIGVKQWTFQQIVELADIYIYLVNHLLIYYGQTGIVVPEITRWILEDNAHPIDHEITSHPELYPSCNSNGLEVYTIPSTMFDNIMVQPLIPKFIAKLDPIIAAFNTSDIVLHELITFFTAAIIMDRTFQL